MERRTDYSTKIQSYGYIHLSVVGITSECLSHQCFYRVILQQSHSVQFRFRRTHLQPILQVASIG